MSEICVCICQSALTFETFLDCFGFVFRIKSPESIPRTLCLGIVRWKRGDDVLDLHFFTWLIEVERPRGQSRGSAGTSFPV